MTEYYDLIFSIGPYCRPAYYLELCDIRTKAYPFDWLGTNLEIILHLFESDFNDFFESFTDESEKTWHIKDLRNVVDQNGVVSVHHIPLSKPLEEGVEEFKKLMLKRYFRLKNDLNNADNIAMVTNQAVERNELIKFLKEFSKIYPRKRITLIEVHSSKDEDKIVTNIRDDLTLIEYYFTDINKDGDSPSENPNFWLGNEDKWISIMNELKLERKIKNE